MILFVSHRAMCRQHELYHRSLINVPRKKILEENNGKPKPKTKTKLRTTSYAFVFHLTMGSIGPLFTVVFAIQQHSVSL